MTTTREWPKESTLASYGWVEACHSDIEASTFRTSFLRRDHVEVATRADVERDHAQAVEKQG